MRTVWRLLGFLKPFAGWAVLSVILSAATVFAGIGLLGTSADLIARAALRPSIATLQVAIVGVRFFGITKAVLRYLERLVSHSVNFRLLAQLRVWFYNRLEPLSPAGLQDYRSGDVLQRVIGDIETLENFYVRVLAPPVSAIVITAGMGWFVGLVDWRVGAILLSGLLAGGLGISSLAYWIGRKVGAAYVRQRGRLNAEMVSVLQGITDLVAYGQEKVVQQRLEQLLEEISQSQRRLVWGNGFVSGLMVALTNLTLVLVLWLAIPLVEGGALEGYRLAVLAILTLASFEAVNALPQAMQLLKANVESAERLFELSDQNPAVCEPSCPERVPESQPPYLVINDLTFRYPSRSSLALEGIRFSLTPPKKIAIVGESGSGKSTIIQLLMRYWEYENGEILLNGVNYKKLDSRDIRQFFGVVTATPYLFSATLRQNLSIGFPNASEQELLEVIERVGLKGWFSSLPNGLDTWVGEHGRLMSGGERQRLAVGRALLSKAPFILLDEPTTGLDSIREIQLMQTIFDVFRDRSLLWVTHRLIGMDRVDEIIVLRAGQVVERGEHNRLLAAGGLYAGLWQAQQRILWGAGPELLV